MSKFNVGDKVRVDGCTATRRSSAGWEEEMDQTIGADGDVLLVDDDSTVKVQFGDPICDYWWYHEDDLTLVEAAKPEHKFKAGDKVRVVDADDIHCRDIDTDKPVLIVALSPIGYNQYQVRYVTTDGIEPIGYLSGRHIIPWVDEPAKPRPTLAEAIEKANKTVVDGLGNGAKYECRPGCGDNSGYLAIMKASFDYDKLPDVARDLKRIHKAWKREQTCK